MSEPGRIPEGATILATDRLAPLVDTDYPTHAPGCFSAESYTKD